MNAKQPCWGNDYKGRQSGNLNASEMLVGFFEVVREDPRLRTCHISLYTAMLAQCLECGGSNPVFISRATIMKTAKISSRQTYNKAMCDQKSFGYIRLVGSATNRAASAVFFKRP